MQNKYLLIILILSIILIGKLSVFGKVDSNKLKNDKAEVIDNFLQKLNKNGFSGSILVSDGKNVFNKCYGFADREKKIECDADTVFDIGSVTKQFTGAAILKLEMQGKLSVTDRIDKYFNNLPVDKKAITIHQLLTHSSGFVPAIGDDYEKLEREAFLQRAFQTKLNSEPGVKYRYSNVGYSVLAAIIEKVSNESYEQYLHNNLFEPAKMYNTGYKIPDWKPEQIAVGYRGEKRWGKPTEKDWGKNAPYWNLLGNGGIISTTRDLYKWHTALLTDEILNDRAKAKFYKRHIEEGESAGTFYGYGWALFPTPRKTTLITHNGGNGIFFCDFLRYTEEKITIILLSNSMRREFERIPNEIAKTFLAEDYTPNIKINSAQKSKVALDKHPNSKLLKDLFSSIKTQDKDKITKFIKANFTGELINMVSMDQHFEFLSGLGGDIKNSQIKEISFDEAETEVAFQGREDKVLIVIENGKIAGMRF